VKRLKLRLSLSLVGAGVVVSLALIMASVAGAAPRSSCSGTFDSPGTLSGTYSNVVIRGVCGVTGTTTIKGNLVLARGSTLAAVFAGADLSVHGNVHVKRDGTLLAGCDPVNSTCIDDPTGSSSTSIAGNLIETRPLGAVIHDSSIGGNVVSSGGGGGVTCEPSGVFAQFGAPVFSAYESSHIAGNIRVTGYRSCWLGINHDHIGGSVHLLHNRLADPDAIEVLDNTIGSNIVCRRNSMTWDSADTVEGQLYPRAYEPNTVGGIRVGQCVVAPPIDSPTGVSPGPF
jgi:hypothetical protein